MEHGVLTAFDPIEVSPCLLTIIIILIIRFEVITNLEFHVLETLNKNLSSLRKKKCLWLPPSNKGICNG